MRKHARPMTPRMGGRELSLLLVAIICLTLFPSTDLLAQEGTSRTFWERHGKVEDATSAPEFTPRKRLDVPSEPVPLTLDNLRIPVQHGTLKKTYSAREPIIIHIQDAHANYEAQKHLASILEYLILAHEISLILVEGGSRNDSLSYMREYAPLEKRQQVAEEFLRSGKISGENYLDLTTDYNFTVFGIERPEYYDQNMEAFFNVEKVQGKAIAVIAGFHEAVGALKERLYPEDVRVLEAKEADVKEGKIPLARHYEDLAELAMKVEVALEEGEFPNLIKFLEASRLEKELNFKKVEAQRGQFLDALTQSLPKEEMDLLLKQSLELKGGLVTPATFYGHLKVYMRQNQQANYPVLFSYMEYLELFEAIDHASLFTEVEEFSGQIKGSYFTNKKQRKLFQVAKDVQVLGDLLELKLTPDAYNYYKSHKREFKPNRWAKDLNALGKKEGFTFSLNSRPLSAAMPAMSSFYEIARKRDKAMVANALKQIKEFDVPVAVLIAGGFHTPVFEQLFKKEKVSYAIVAPKVGRVTAADTEKYHRVLKETYVPMSEKYRQKLGIQPPPALRVQKDKQTTSAAATEFRPVSFPETGVLALTSGESAR